MAPESAVHQKFVGLPTSVVGPVDVGRLIRELEAIDNSFLQQKLQQQEAKLAKTSKLMDQLILMNKLDLTKETDRADLKNFLTTIRERAPLVHMSFGADPSPLFIEKLMTWLRENIHPVVLLTVGLQPNIGAGSMVRTDNKYFDFSLGKRFGEKRDMLMKMLRADAPEAPVDGVVVAPAVEAAPVAAAEVAA